MRDYIQKLVDAWNRFCENIQQWNDPIVLQFIINEIFNFVYIIFFFISIPCLIFYALCLKALIHIFGEKAVDEDNGINISEIISCFFYINKDGHKTFCWPITIEVDSDDKNLEENSEDIFPSPLEGFMIFNDYTIFKFTSQLFFNIFLNFFFIFLFILPLLIIFQNKFYNISFHLLNIFKFFFDLFKNIIVAVRLERFFFFLLSIFTVIIFFNFGGFSLHELSFTSHAFVTLFLSFIIFFNIFFNILVNFNSFFYKKFIQENLNILLTVLLFIIEIISFFIRPLSLGIRLFTNILAGHILIHIFFGFFLFLYSIIFWFSFLVFIFCNLILGLEIFVAIIQSYIFFVLSVVYLKDAFVLHG